MNDTIVNMSQHQLNMLDDKYRYEFLPSTVKYNPGCAVCYYFGNWVMHCSVRVITFHKLYKLEAVFQNDAPFFAPLWAKKWGGHMPPSPPGSKAYV